MMLRRLAALAALPVLAVSLAAAPALAAEPEPPAPPSDTRHPSVWVCTDPSDVSIDLGLGGLLGLDVDLDLLRPWNGLYCGWVPVR